MILAALTWPRGCRPAKSLIYGVVFVSLTAGTTLAAVVSGIMFLTGTIYSSRADRRVERERHIRECRDRLYDDFLNLFKVHAINDPKNYMSDRIEEDASSKVNRCWRKYQKTQKTEHLARVRRQIIRERRRCSRHEDRRRRISIFLAVTLTICILTSAAAWARCHPNSGFTRYLEHHGLQHFFANSNQNNGQSGSDGSSKPEKSRAMKRPGRPENSPGGLTGGIPAGLASSSAGPSDANSAPLPSANTSRSAGIRINISDDPLHRIIPVIPPIHAAIGTQGAGVGIAASIGGLVSVGLTVNPRIGVGLSLLP
jgi:hypothetical protein